VCERERGPCNSDTFNYRNQGNMHTHSISLLRGERRREREMGGERGVGWWGGGDKGDHSDRLLTPNMGLRCQGEPWVVWS
jgi:hypothetical protein